MKIDDLKLSCFIKKVLISIRRKQSNSNLNNFNNQKNRKIKSALYRITRYITLFENKKNYMHDYNENNISQNMKNFCNILMKKKQFVFQNSLFRKNIFKKIYRKIKNRNETKIIQNIVRLIVFFAEILAIYEITHFDYLIEKINEN